jgi:hypothetical protein
MPVNCWNHSHLPGIGAKPVRRWAAKLEEMVLDNDTFPRQGRCLLFAEYSATAKDCHACRSIAWCKYYDHAGVGEILRLDITRWEENCRQRVALALRYRMYRLKS